MIELHAAVLTAAEELVAADAKLKQVAELQAQLAALGDPSVLQADRDTKAAAFQEKQAAFNRAVVGG